MIRTVFNIFFANIWAFVFALLVHGLLFGLIGLNLNFTKPARLIEQQPMQAVALGERLKDNSVAKPEAAEPMIESSKQPESEPVVAQKPKPAEVEKLAAEQLQRDKKAAEVEKLAAAQRKRDKKAAEVEKLAAEQLQRNKKAAEAKKLAAAQRKRDEKAAEVEKLAAKQRKRDEKAAEAKAAKDKLIAEQRAREAALQAQIDAERIEGEKDAAWGLAIGRIKKAVIKKFNIKSFSPGLQTYYTIELFPGGAVKDVKIKASSGNQLYDEDVQKAILEASPLPIPTNPLYFDDTIIYDHSS